jgi:hypothetical protein
MPEAPEVVAEPVTAEPVVEPDPAGTEALGDPGKKALDTMKAERNTARAAEREARDQIAALTAKAEGRETEYAAELAGRKVETDALAKANTRILSAEVRALAAGKLADPKDALKFLDLSAFEVGDDGEVDTAAITAAIEDLVASKSYLAAQGGKNGTVFESPGAHRNGAAAGQVTEAELARMSPAQINAARAAGRLDDVLGIKH